MGSPYNLGQSAAGFGNTLAERYKQWQDSIRQGAAQAGRFVGDVGETVGDAYSQGGLFGLPAKPIIGAMESFGAGMRGEAMPGQDIELKQESLLPPAPRWAIEDGLKLGGVDAVGEDGVPENLRAPDGAAPSAPKSPGAGLTGQSLKDALGYKDNSNAVGPRETRSAFGQEYQVPMGGGSLSVMNDNPQNHSLAQKMAARELADADPATGLPPQYAGLGINRGEMRGIATQGMIRGMDPKAQMAQESDALRAEAMSDLQYLEGELRKKGFPPEVIQQRMEAATKELFLKLGIREGEYGALGTYLKPNPMAIGG